MLMQIKKLKKLQKKLMELMHDFQTEKQLKEFGDKLSDDKKAPIETALADLKGS